MTVNTTLEPRRFLFVMWEGAGSVSQELGVARRLVERGHTVRVLGDPSMAEDARAAGCTFVPYVNAPHRVDRSPQTDFIRDWELSPLQNFVRQRDRLVFGPALAYARDLLDELEREPADALAIDESLFGAQVGAEKSGIPTAVLTPHFYLFPAPGLPAPGGGFLPPRGALDRVRDAVFGAVVKRLFRSGLGALNQTRRQLGLASLGHPFEQFDRAARRLLLTSQAIDFEARALPPNVRYVGPVVDDPPWVHPWQAPWPLDHPDPLVLVAFSSMFQGQAAILQRVIDALGALKVRGLVTVGYGLDPEQFRAPPNVSVVHSAPHRELFPQASAMVNHAGHSTLIKALVYGVPQVCIPRCHNTPDNAARIVAKGVGLRVTPGATIPAMAEAIRRVVEEPRFAENARRIASNIAEELRRPRAVEELEAIALREQARAVGAPAPRPITEGGAL